MLVLPSPLARSEWEERSLHVEASTPPPPDSFFLMLSEGRTNLKFSFTGDATVFTQAHRTVPSSQTRV